MIMDEPGASLRTVYSNLPAWHEYNWLHIHLPIFLHSAIQFAGT